MKKIQDHAHLTLTQTLIVAADMRIVTNDRKLFEPHLGGSLVERNHCVDELFSKTVYEGEPVVCFDKYRGSDTKYCLQRPVKKGNTMD